MKTENVRTKLKPPKNILENINQKQFHFKATRIMTLNLIQVHARMMQVDAEAEALGDLNVVYDDAWNGCRHKLNIIAVEANSKVLKLLQSVN